MANKPVQINLLQFYIHSAATRVRDGSSCTIYVATEVRKLIFVSSR